MEAQSIVPEKKEDKVYLVDMGVSRVRRKLLKHYLLLRILLVVSILSALSLFIGFLFPSISVGLNEIFTAPKLAIDFVIGRTNLLKQDGGRVNFLILGLTDESKKGEDLTDSIIFVSIDMKSGDSALVSIPRDVWVDSMKAKINTAFHYGELKKPGGGGLILAKSSVAELLGQPVHYALVINFDGFRKIIDSLGGVDVDVERTFDDFKYPVVGNETAQPESDRYKHLHFDKGTQHMDGVRALEYVRSRQAEGEEGTDFARSERQKRLILAVKKKALSAEILLNPKRVLELKLVGNGLILSDISEREFAVMGRTLFRALNKSPRLVSVSSFLINPLPGMYQGQYVLVPKSGTWNEIRGYVNGLVKE